MNIPSPLRFTLGVGGSLVCIAGAFAAGTRFQAKSSAVHEAGPHRILYYQDPMHPSYRAEKPGKAPDCGMDLEPVYADSVSTPNDPDPNSVAVTDLGSKLVGIKTVQVTRNATGGSFQVPGKVSIDESRLFRVTALADGVVRQVSPLGIGSQVHKGESLATYFVPTRDLYAAVQAFVLASGSYDQVASNVHDTAVLKTSKAQARVEQELLESYGLSAEQIRDLARTREVTRDIDFRAPASGIVLDRSASIGQTVARGAELFRIADLHHVWVLADVYESDLNLFPAGRKALVRYGGATFSGVVSTARAFDTASHTFRVRIDVENSSQQLRPDMFVKIELPSEGHNVLTVPSDSVLETGKRTVVYVSTGTGQFAPRAVTIGRELNGHTEILSGLRETDNVVSQGAFLLDSESRIKAAATEPDLVPAAMETSAHESLADPVCGMPLNEKDSALSEQYEGKSYFFCSRRCKDKFDHDRAKYATHDKPGSRA